MRNTILIISLLFISLSCSKATKNITEAEPTVKKTHQPISFKKIALQLNAISVNEEVFILGEDMQIDLNIDLTTGMYNGKSSCNGYFGKVELINDHKLMFVAGGMTEMLCDKETMEWEARYMNALIGKEFYYNLKEKTVVFSDEANSVSLSFVSDADEEEIEK